MPLKFNFAPAIDLHGARRIRPEYAIRQQVTAKAILHRFHQRPGVILADEVGMGKTFVALAVACSVVLRNPKAGPVVVMVPPGLKDKWPTDWSVFRDKCLNPGAQKQIRVPQDRDGNPDSIESGVEFLKLLDDDDDKRCNLIFLTHGALTRGLRDPWVKLALLRRTFRRQWLRSRIPAFCRLAPEILGTNAWTRDNPDLFHDLLSSRPAVWRKIIERHGGQVADDPVPEDLVKAIETLDDTHIDSIAEALGKVPARWSRSERKRIRVACAAVSDALSNVWEPWLASACRRVSLPLLILDEAHHLKNPYTNLASLFLDQRAEDEAEMLKVPLNAVFDRMLFLTATPFQLGHHELMRVLDRFKNVAWNRPPIPSASRDGVGKELEQLEKALDDARSAALVLDRVWGRLRPADLRHRGGSLMEVEQWWSQIQKRIPDPNSLVGEVRQQYLETHRAMKTAEKLLQPWVIRHRWPPKFPNSHKNRREFIEGASILGKKNTAGIPVDGEALLPFLLAARARTLALDNRTGRAMFAEGLASSFEAYRQTRHGELEVDEDDQYASFADDVAAGSDIRWYLQSLDESIPSGDPDKSSRHPKISATVNEVLRLWEKGEKVLVFCHYRATGRALQLHISRALDRKLLELAAARFGCATIEAARRRLVRLGRRFQSRKDTLRKAADDVLPRLASQYCRFSPEEVNKVVEIMRRFFRTRSFLARYFTLEGKGDPVSHALKQKDASGLTLRQKFVSLCKFLNGRTPSERQAYLEALENLQTGKHWTIAESSAGASRSRSGKPRAGGERLLANVRLANGETDAETRRRLLLAFNTPFFPEILVASSVLSEGVDLHLQCRHVIHHDLCWNPSTLEQRTGRVDRLDSKAQNVLQPVQVYLPYVAATQDERMYQVVKDRQRWFQVVMGEKYIVDEYAADDAQIDRLTKRIPFPETAALALAFSLEVFQK